MIDFPEFPTAPYNSSQHITSAMKGAILGLALSFLVVMLYALLRNTVRKETDVTQKLQTTCLGIIPLVVPKGNRKMTQLSIQNSKVGTPFKESFRGLALQTVRMMEDKKVLLITATADNEGASTVAQNLAYALTEQGKQVILIDSNTQSANEIRLAREEADFVIIDAPSCQSLSKITPFAERSDAILYAIRQDYSKLPQIMNCFEDLNQFEAKLIGCVLTGVRPGITGYGYGYGYGYGDHKAE
jgi:Mrp family chromosome partitioning ATPase